MSTWLIYALLSALSASLVAIFGKIGLQHLDANTATAVRAVVMALFLVGVVVVQGKFNLVGTVLADKKALLFIVLSGVAGALSWLFYFMAIKNGTVSQVAPIDKLNVVFAVLLAFILFGEKISLVAGLGVALITAGALMVALG
ncbi:EamA family transporter [Yersinia pseudotuberculosis]|uniref:EamA domain-containing protein n=2 Tax=Yersinia pseudotuberculosis complex TaxID=1649845 RepID=A0A0H3AZA5_YERPY|nr:EamA family transporter [Yersinia pseudotuberculosis]AJJ59968.1 eamA-like transporter family protein [Yersinia pseudotuberculosis YPIII]AYW87200.1 EamA family transporter [Yersinia pseudotuberculosis]AYX01804.1 EamA family transporter [Yersinia pseudotuberculosis]AZA29560.1 EamA family transporter [Yersinia pseudotuberculosis]MBK1425686.1 EamA family transporter [Yersinia pseudotuberculosis]